MRRPGIAAHLAAATIGVSTVALVIVGVGVQRIGESEFEHLMVLHGASLGSAQEMFANSVTIVLLAAMAAAVSTTLFLATALARWMSRPVLRMSDAAERLAAGDHDVRLRTTGPREVASLAESFNQLAAELGRQDKVRQEFIENSSHELRTPLTNLQGYLEALRDGVVPPGPEVFRSLHEEVERLVRLADSLEVLSSGDGLPAQPRRTDVVQALRTSIAAARPMFERRGIRVSTRAPATAEVVVDPDHLAQILSNLLQNASRYADEGGDVEVRVAANGHAVGVEITNSGREIPAEDLPRIFERFYRVDKSRNRAAGGAGVGLAIVKQLVISAGGELGADSHPDQTRFWFRLPSPVNAR